MWTLFITIISKQYRLSDPGQIAVSTQVIGSITSEKRANQIATQIVKSLEKSALNVHFVVFQRDELAS